MVFAAAENSGDHYRAAKRDFYVMRPMMAMPAGGYSNQADETCSYIICGEEKRGVARSFRNGENDSAIRHER